MTKSFALTHHLGFHGNGHASHWEEGEDRLVEASVLKEVPREVNREEVTLGAHTGHMPECNISFTDDELAATEHDAIHTWGQREIQSF